MIFSELRGQARAVEQLRGAWARERLHHGLLFVGPPGVGKARCAEALAALLLCNAPTAEQEACTRCPACARVAQRTHPDLLSLRRELAKSGKPSTELKVTQIRALQQQLSYQAFEGGRRVVLIEEAERLNLAAANALLKTLEEPSPGTYFILLSDAPERLIPTIRSRCQLIRFSPLEVGLLQALLQEQRALGEEEAAFIARLSEGSLGRAAALIESELLGERVELLETLDREDRLRGVEGRLQRAEQLAKRPEEELRLLLHLLRSWFRDVLFSGWFLTVSNHGGSLPRSS